MSTFRGRMREYTNVSLDRFDGDNLRSTVYCLSHNHADHTVGLDSLSLHYRLESNTAIKLYCSQVTKNLLLWEQKYKFLDRHIITIPEDTPTIIDIPDPESGKKKKQVTLTLLHAGHCPGSVMLLLEGDEGTVLYTGDFRLSKENLLAMQHLMPGGRPKLIKSLYLDTTFCIPEAFYIPSREDSAQAIVELAKEWVCQGPEYLIHLTHRANLGYEYLYIKLAEELETRVHVNKAKYDKYSGIPSLHPYLTTDGSSTQIHMCRWHYSGGHESPLPCFHARPGSQPPRVRSIYVSTMYFVNAVRTDRFVRQKGERRFHVCYSFHSSYSEIRDMILCLQPQRAFANVVPKIGLGQSKMKMQERVNQFVKLAGAVKESRKAVSGPQPLGTLKRKHVHSRVFKTTSSQDSDSDSLDFGTQQEFNLSKRPDLHGTPKKKQKRRKKSTTPVKEGVFHVEYDDDGEEECDDLNGNGQGHIDVDDADGESNCGSDYNSDASNKDNDDLYRELEDAREKLTNTPVKGESSESSLAYISDDDEDADVDPEVDEDENPEESQRSSAAFSLSCTASQFDESQVPNLQLSSLDESSVELQTASSSRNMSEKANLLPIRESKFDDFDNICAENGNSQALNLHLSSVSDSSVVISDCGKPERDKQGTSSEDEASSVTNRISKKGAVRKLSLEYGEHSNECGDYCDSTSNGRSFHNNKQSQLDNVNVTNCEKPEVGVTGKQFENSSQSPSDQENVSARQSVCSRVSVEVIEPPSQSIKASLGNHEALETNTCDLDTSGNSDTKRVCSNISRESTDSRNSVEIIEEPLNFVKMSEHKPSKKSFSTITNNSDKSRQKVSLRKHHSSSSRSSVEIIEPYMFDHHVKRKSSGSGEEGLCLYLSQSSHSQDEEVGCQLKQHPHKKAVATNRTHDDLDGKPCSQESDRTVDYSLNDDSWLDEEVCELVDSPGNVNTIVNGVAVEPEFELVESKKSGHTKEKSDRVAINSNFAAKSKEYSSSSDHRKMECTKLSVSDTRTDLSNLKKNTSVIDLTEDDSLCADDETDWDSDDTIDPTEQELEGDVSTGLGTEDSDCEVIDSPASQKSEDDVISLISSDEY